MMHITKTLLQRSCLALMLLVGLSVWGAPTITHANQTIAYQARIATLDDAVVDDGAYNFSFALYDTPTGGSPVWQESYIGGDRITVTNGLATVMLGSNVPFTGIDFTRPLYLGVTVGGSDGTPVWDTEMAPRRVVGASAFAFASDTLDGFDSTAFLQASTTNTVTVNTADTAFTINQLGAGNILTLFGSSTELLTLTDVGRFGLGNTNPLQRFMVGSDFWVTDTADVVAQSVTVADGTSAAPAVAFTSDSDTGLFRPAPDTVGVTAGGVVAATITSAGDLDLAGGLVDDMDSTGPANSILQSTGDGFRWVDPDGITGVETSGFLRNDESGMLVANATSALLTIQQTGSGSVLETYASTGLALTVAANGSVGIGTSTPSQKLTVANGDIQIDANQYLRTLTNTGASVPLIGLDGLNQTVIGAHQEIRLGESIYLGPQGTGDIVAELDADTDFSAGIDMFFVDGDSGNVGIGTTTPTRTLTVAGDLSLAGLLYDSFGSSGNFGDVLVRNGSGVAWTATTTLGLSDAEVQIHTFDGPETWAVLSGLGGVTTVSVDIDAQAVGAGTLRLIVDGVATELPIGVRSSLVVEPSDTLSIQADAQRYIPRAGTSFATEHDVFASVTGLAFSTDGTQLFTADHINNRINTYGLTTPYDLATISTFSNQSFPYDAYGLTFSPDGTKMYTTYIINNQIREYSLSSPYNVASALTTLPSFLSVASEDTVPRDIALSADGTRLFMVGEQTDTVYSYRLDQPFNVSSAVLLDSFSLAGTIFLPSGIEVTGGGTHMHVLDRGTDRVYTYRLSQPWDLSSVSALQSFSVATQTFDPSGIAFNDTGDRMFIAGGGTSNEVNEYILPASPWTGIAEAVVLRGQDGGADLAELYPTVSSGIEAGDIVSFIDDDSFALTYATAESDLALAGIVSTDPGITLSDFREGSSAVPLALSGRVPTKVNLEGGVVMPGDRITPSSVPGVGRKATLFEPSVGTALTGYDAEDPTAVQSVMVFVRLDEGVNIYNLTDTLFAGASTTFILPQAEIDDSQSLTAAANATTTVDVVATEAVIATESIWTRLAQLAARFRDGVLALVGLQVLSIETDTITVAEELCVGTVCVNEADLAALMAGGSADTATVATADSESVVTNPAIPADDQVDMVPSVPSASTTPPATSTPEDGEATEGIAADVVATSTASTTAPTVSLPATVATSTLEKTTDSVVDAVDEPTTGTSSQPVADEPTDAVISPVIGGAVDTETETSESISDTSDVTVVEEEVVDETPAPDTDPVAPEEPTPQTEVVEVNESDTQG